MIARRRMHNANVRHRRLSQHTRYVSISERPFQRSDIIELDYLCSDRGIYRRTDISRPRSGCSVRRESDEGLIDRAVIAPVVDENLFAARNLPRQTDRKSVV